MSAHVHVWIHVAYTDYLGRASIVCRCSCGEILTRDQIAGWSS